MELTGEVSRIARHSVGVETHARMSVLESLAVTQVEPPRAEVSASGRRFAGGTSIISNGIAPVTAIPTTTATLALFNLAQQGSGSVALVIERLGFFLGSGTPTAGATMLACVSPRPIASPPTAMATGYALSSLSGTQTRLSKALWTTAVTLPTTPTSPAWFQVTSTFQLAAANVGQGDIVSDFEGAIIVPPGHALGLAILSGTGTTPLYGVSAMWSELELEVE